MCVRPSFRPSVQKKIKARVSKFHIWIPHQKIAYLYFFSSTEPKAHGELIVYQSSRRPSVRLSTLSNIIISTTSRPIPTKFYLKHHWGGGKASLGFGPDRFGTLVSMATESPHRVIMGKILLTL